MSFPYLLIFAILIVYSSGTFVTKKTCANVDNSKCQVQSVDVDPCPKGVYYCPLKTSKVYDLTVKFTPHFAAEKLRYSIIGDVQNNGNFETVFIKSDNACFGFQCPLAAESDVEGHIPLILSKAASGKFPIQVKLWNKENEEEACCFTFNAKIKK